MNLHIATKKRPQSLGSYLKSRSADTVVTRNGFIEIPVDPKILQPLIARVIAEMMVLTDEPSRWGHFPWHTIETDEYGPDYAQEVGLRPPEENKRDERKFTFQYVDKMILGLQARGVPLHEYADFLQALSGIAHEGKRLTLALAESFDERNAYADYGLYNGSLVERLRKGLFVIRVLRYLERPQEVLRFNLPDAAEHIDRGMFTPHIWSSHPGLYVYTPERERCEVAETNFSSIAVFPGKKFAAATRGKFGYGTVHGVRDTRRSDVRTLDRFAIVGFAHPVALPGDVAWLQANKAAIGSHEKSFRIHAPT